MLIELKGAVMLTQPGKTGIITEEPHMCPCCKRMTFFFENVRGETRCTACPSNLPTRQ